MASAVNEPSLSLERRFRLSKIEVWIKIAAVPALLRASGAELATEKLLRGFVDQNIQSLRRLHQNVMIPRVGNWSLEREDSSTVDIGNWNPECENGSTLYVKCQDLDGSLSMRSGFGNESEPTVSFPGTWQILSEHVLLVVTKSKLVRIKKKSKQRVVVAIYDMLVSKDHTLGRLLKEVGGLSGSWMQTDTESSEGNEFFSQDIRSIKSIAVTVEPTK